MRTLPRLAVIALALFGSAQAANSTDAPLQVISDGPAERVAFQHRIRQHFASDHFAQLDQMAKELWQQRAKFREGVWKLSAFYDALRLPGRRTVDNTEDDFTAFFGRVNRWEKQFPDSATAKIVHAEVLTQYAWKARGGGYAPTVTAPGWRVFAERLKQARALLDSDPALQQWPGYYSVMQTIALGEQWPRHRYDKLCAAAVRLAPDYETFYFRTAYYLQPKWYGTRDDEWHDFAVASAKATEKQLGQTLYTRIVWATLPARWTDASAFRDAHIDWPRMKAGFNDLAKQYPDSLWNKNAYCFYAWASGDQDTARQLFDDLHGRYAPQIWENASHFKRAEAWAHGTGFKWATPATTQP